jgi:hypothetical protein
MNSTALISHENISKRAHQIWEESGRPDGSEMAHWLQAESELRAQHGNTGEADGERGKSVEPRFPAKHTPEKAPHSANYVHPGVTTDSLHHVRNR